MLETCGNQSKGRVAKVLGFFRRAWAAKLKQSCAELSPVLTKVIREYEESPGGGSKGIFFPGAGPRKEDAKAARELFYENGAEEGEGGEGLDDAEVVVSEHEEPLGVQEIAIIGTAEKSGHACAYKGRAQLACLFLQHKEGAASLTGAGLSASLVRGSFLQTRLGDLFLLGLLCVMLAAYFLAFAFKAISLADQKADLCFIARRSATWTVNSVRAFYFNRVQVTDEYLDQKHREDCNKYKRLCEGSPAPGGCPSP
ncbi:unnamed protein product [Amoebophrya sp. A25]|nr:unnamed protein product [Amoebophrya sp. A25]|eukprot:GSA25T00022120001.1